MSTTNLVSMELSEQLVKNIISEQMTLQIAKALGQNSDQIILSIVGQALNQKVSSNGTISSYSSDNKHSWAEIVLTKHIQDTAKEAMKNWVKENEPRIINAVEKSLKQNTNKIVGSIMESLISSANSTYGFQVNVTPRMSGRD